MKRNTTSYYTDEANTSAGYSRTQNVLKTHKVLSSNLSLLPQIITQHLNLQ